MVCGRSRAEGGSTETPACGAPGAAPPSGWGSVCPSVSGQLAGPVASGEWSECDSSFLDPKSSGEGRGCQLKALWLPLAGPPSSLPHGLLESCGESVRASAQLGPLGPGGGCAGGSAAPFLASCELLHPHPERGLAVRGQALIPVRSGLLQRGWVKLPQEPKEEICAAFGGETGLLGQDGEPMSTPPRKHRAWREPPPHAFPSSWLLWVPAPFKRLLATRSLSISAAGGLPFSLHQGRLVPPIRRQRRVFPIPCCLSAFIAGAEEERPCCHRGAQPLPSPSSLCPKALCPPAWLPGLATKLFSSPLLGEKRLPEGAGHLRGFCFFPAWPCGGQLWAERPLLLTPPPFCCAGSSF